jgi:hypothetical protein
MALEPPSEADFPPGFLHELGHIVVRWSNVEHETERALYEMADMKGRDAYLVLGHMDFRGYLAALKSVAFLRMDGASFGRLEAWINALGGDYRNYRNRLMHDFWNPFPEDTEIGIPFVHQGNISSKIIKKPPSGEKRLQISNHQPVGIEELKLFLEDLKDAWRFMVNLRRYTRGKGLPDGLPDPSWRYKSAPPYPRSSPSFDQRTYKPERPPQP